MTHADEVLQQEQEQLIRAMHEAANMLPSELRAVAIARITEYAAAETENEKNRIADNIKRFTMKEAVANGWCSESENILRRLFGEDWDVLSTGQKYDRSTRAFYDENGVDDEGFNAQGVDSEGFNREGWNARGFDKDGYDRNGYNEAGYNKDGYDRNGYNEAGLNVDGLSKFRFDEEGWDSAGFNCRGLDREGYDRDGWSSNGYNRNGIRKTTGRDEHGFDENGLDRGGKPKFRFDPSGYDEDGYRWDGYDRDGYRRAENAQMNRSPRLH